METGKIGKLILARHGESEWNKLGKWTGLTDIPLSEHGKEESIKMGELVKDIHFDYLFTSKLIRAKETLSLMTAYREDTKNIQTEEASELNERDYGDYTGKNKWEIEKLIGEKEFIKLRRGWDFPICNGESLKMVYERTVPFFLKKILPIILESKNVLVVAHGNSIRSIIKYIENIPDEKIDSVEMNFGSILIYDLDKDGHMVKKEERKLE
ncbi:MAG TPA: 2,3-bisphosphoglycerate-dependent phosphoglycerate mutase [Candidatus Paceibacterota bacterium]|nr:2,3-bisphosphoglycerate-dependent phosphoglycerate mutase [Candidatus Paceibacterota bacterium]HPT17849.1 2,3-bisphosphoglycerate-dependent phosphoglycerate mutase [Candidatus Paceibacterota bacterium]